MSVFGSDQRPSRRDPVYHVLNRKFDVNAEQDFFGNGASKTNWRSHLVLQGLRLG